SDRRPWKPFQAEIRWPRGPFGCPATRSPSRSASARNFFGSEARRRYSDSRSTRSIAYTTGIKKVLRNHLVDRSSKWQRRAQILVRNSSALRFLYLNFVEGGGL